MPWFDERGQLEAGVDLMDLESIVYAPPTEFYVPPVKVISNATPHQDFDRMWSMTPLEPQMATLDQHVRLIAQAWHPSSRGPVPHLVNVETPYMALEAPADAVWPRATIRPLPLMRGQENWWAAKIWDAPGVPAYVDASYGLTVPDGCWVSSNFEHLSDAVDWAATEVDRRRPKADPADPLESPC